MNNKKILIISHLVMIAFFVIIYFMSGFFQMNNMIVTTHLQSGSHTGALTGYKNLGYEPTIQYFAITLPIGSILIFLLYFTRNDDTRNLKKP